MSSTPAKTPNVVVVVADDLGWGDLSCYGAKAIDTPHIDSLADSGVQFTDAHASSAVCTPSRYSIVTGMYPWRSPLQNGVLGGTDPAIVTNQDAALPQLFKKNGYRCGAFGKWHLGLNWMRTDGSRPSAFEEGFRPDMQATGFDVDYSVPFTGGPTDLGFDYFYGIAGSLDMPPYCFIENDRTIGIPDREKSPLITSQRPGLQVEGWRDDLVDVKITEAVTAWIDDSSDSDEPFFAYVAAAAPHRPCVPPAFVAGKSRAGARGDGVILVDWMVGEIIRSLTAIGELDNTIIIVTSDNGAPMIFPEDGDVETHRPNGAWRGQKGDTWEGGHRVPLVISGPGFDISKECADLVTLVDLAPMLADRLFGEKLDVDGRPWGPFGSSRSASGRVVAQQAFDGSLSLRTENFKVIFSDGSGGFSEPVGQPQNSASSANQIYDLASDPAETTNLWSTGSNDAIETLGVFTSATGLRLKADGQVGQVQ